MCDPILGHKSNLPINPKPSKAVKPLLPSHSAISLTSKFKQMNHASPQSLRRSSVCTSAKSAWSAYYHGPMMKRVRPVCNDQLFYFFSTSKNTTNPKLPRWPPKLHHYWRRPLCSNQDSTSRGWSSPKANFWMIEL